MLVLQYKTGLGLPVESPDLTDDPEMHDNFALQDFYFKPDGTSVYIVGFKTPGADQAWVHQYDLSVAWDITTMSHSGNILEVTTQEKWASAIDIRSDGTTLWIGGQSNGKLHSYTMSTPWDVSSATHTASTASALAGSIQGIVFQHDDGSRVFITSPHTSNEIWEFTVSTHWDITSITPPAASVSTNVSATASQTSGLYIRDNGTWWYVTSYVGDDINQHLSSFGYAPSTIAASLAEVDTTDQTTSPFGISFSSTGDKMYIGHGSASTVKIFQYALGSDWLIASASI